jgi:sigma-B regulation protein RsbU (phosphoserine phosphatase)
MKLRHALYIPLILLFGVAALYQVRATRGSLQALLHPAEKIQLPVSIDGTSPLIEQVDEETGNRRQYHVMAVNGVPYTGRAVVSEATKGLGPGDEVAFTVRPTEGAGEATTLHVKLSGASKPNFVDWLVASVLSNAGPTLCLLLGFWVAGIRVRDPMAWLLLALMLSFAHVLLSFEQLEWHGWQLYLASGFHVLFGSTIAIWMLLFGIYFPERSPFDVRWPWAKWVLIVPLALFTLANVVIEEGAQRNFAAVASLDELIRPFRIAERLIGMAAFSGFFAGLGAKVSMAATPDARRRLRLLMAGAEISLGPLFLVALYSLVRGKQIFEGVPPILGIPTVLLLFLFPVTMAYVIVVHRALDLRVVVRLGVRYALARNGVLILRLAIIGVIIFFMAGLITGSNSSPVRISLVVGAGITVIVTLGKLVDRLLGWTDRRFFREAYNAERILTELSENVRTMVETQPLLETVSSRISESLHVPRVAVFLQRADEYVPAHALGYAEAPDVSFRRDAAVVEQMHAGREPLSVYLDDQDSWVYRTAGIDDEERAALGRLGTQLLLPISVKQNLPGFISLGVKQSEEPYSSNDLRLLATVANQTGLALENSQLTAAIAQEVAQRERMNREVEIAKEVQERLFPQELPRVDGLDYCGACRPALGVGGDYYDFLALPGGKLGIAIGDVSGKGIPAALLMASLQASLRGQTINGAEDLSLVMSNINRLVFDASPTNRYATFFYAQYDPVTRQLAYVNAGHNPPVVLRKQDHGWQTMRLEAGGAVIGLLPGIPYQQTTLTMEPGDTFLGFTDGISEAMNTAEEEWGEDQLVATTKSCDGMSAAKILQRIVSAADGFAGDAKQHDDMTLIIVRVLGNSTPLVEP